jgi:hypothetical protein
MNTFGMSTLAWGMGWCFTQLVQRPASSIIGSLNFGTAEDAVTLSGIPLSVLIQWVEIVLTLNGVHAFSSAFDGL